MGIKHTTRKRGHWKSLKRDCKLYEIHYVAFEISMYFCIMEFSWYFMKFPWNFFFWFGNHCLTMKIPWKVLFVYNFNFMSNETYMKLQLSQWDHTETMEIPWSCPVVYIYIYIYILYVHIYDTGEVHENLIKIHLSWSFCGHKA